MSLNLDKAGESSRPRSPAAISFSEDSSDEEGGFGLSDLIPVSYRRSRSFVDIADAGFRSLNHPYAYHIHSQLMMYLKMFSFR